MLCSLTEGNITTDHVVQEDAQAPHSELVPVVTLLDDPLWRGVDSRAYSQYFVSKQNYISKQFTIVVCERL